jgi:hypothetical protein
MKVGGVSLTLQPTSELDLSFGPSKGLLLPLYPPVSCQSMPPTMPPPPLPIFPSDYKVSPSLPSDNAHFCVVVMRTNLLGLHCLLSKSYSSVVERVDLAGGSSSSAPQPNSPTTLHPKTSRIRENRQVGKAERSPKNPNF